MSASYLKLSKTRILLLFIALAALAYFLYPRDLFLAKLYEQSESYEKAENYYRQYLEKHPANKNITLKLVSLYERIGEAQKSKYYLEKLMSIRHKDWELAQFYLDYLNTQNLKEESFQTRLKIAKEFKEDKQIPKKKIVALLEDALQYALWKQKTEEAYTILEELIPIGPQPEEYATLLLQLDAGLKKTEVLKGRLEKSLEQNPENENFVQELIQIYRMLGEQEKAWSLTQNMLQKKPNSLNWLKLAYTLAEKAKNIERQKEFAQKIYALSQSDPEEKKNYGHLLVSLSLQEGNSEKALAYLNELLQNYPQEQSLWKDKISLLSGQKKWESFFPFIEEYQKHFPNDAETQVLLFQVYLYELKNVEKLGFYLAYLKAHPDLKRAQDVAYLYQKTKPELLEKTLLELEKIFPGSSLWLELRYQKAIQEKKEALALEYLLKIEVLRPLSIEEIESVANLYYSIGNKEWSLKYFEKLAQLQPNSNTLKKVGLEFYYEHQLIKAKDYFQKAFLKSPQDATLAYYFAEINLEQKNKKEFLKYAQISKALFEKQKSKSIEEQSLFLKTKLQLKEYQGLDEEYQKLLKKNPHPKDSAYDYAEYLLETQQLQKAKNQIDQLTKNRAAKHLQLRLAFALKNYKEVENLLNEVDPKHQEEDLKDFRRELREVFVPKVSSYFEMSNLGESTLYSGHLEYRQPLARSFSLFSHLQVGHYSDSNLDIRGEFSSLAASLEKQFFPYKIQLNLELGLSEERVVFSPGLEFAFNPSSAYELHFSYQNHQLKTDLPLSLSEGNLQDEWKIHQQGNIKEKLIWTFDLEANRQVLKTGEKSGGYSISPSLQWVFFQKPFFSLGYQYEWAEQKGDDFLSKVPLIERINAHTLSLNYSQSWADQLRVDANFFIGEDFSRHLHAFEGDLWGLQTQMSYSPHRRLDIFARYQYAQESLQADVGHFHQAQVGFTFYWDLYAKRN